MGPITLKRTGTYVSRVQDIRDALSAIEKNVNDPITLAILEDKFVTQNGLRGMIGELNDIIHRSKD